MGGGRGRGGVADRRRWGHRRRSRGHDKGVRPKALLHRIVGSVLYSVRSVFTVYTRESGRTSGISYVFRPILGRRHLWSDPEFSLLSRKPVPPVCPGTDLVYLYNCIQYTSRRSLVDLVELTGVFGGRLCARASARACAGDPKV